MRRKGSYSQKGVTNHDVIHRYVEYICNRLERSPVREKGVTNAKKGVPYTQKGGTNYDVIYGYVTCICDIKKGVP